MPSRRYGVSARFPVLAWARDAAFPLSFMLVFLDQCDRIIKKEAFREAAPR
jgi:hypothetical protein